MNISCEYCGTQFQQWEQSKKSTHKMRCPKKRYLGGTLTMEKSVTAEKLLEIGEKDPRRPLAD